MHYQFIIVQWGVQYMQLKKILKIRTLFVFLISKGMSYLLFKCINEDLTLHQQECFLTNICMFSLARCH